MPSIPCHARKQPPLASPPTDYDEEDWEEEEEEEDDEEDDDAYAALEGLLLGEAGGECCLLCGVWRSKRSIDPTRLDSTRFDRSVISQSDLIH
jgi:hypothetical protein